MTRYLPLLLLLACPLMMFFMMRGMGGGGRTTGNTGPADRADAPLDPAIAVTPAQVLPATGDGVRIAQLEREVAQLRATRDSIRGGAEVGRRP